MARGGGLREALREVAQSASNVARLQAELSRSDLKQTSALGLGAAVFGVLAFLLLTTLFVIALAIPLPAWLAILIVMLVYMAIAAALGAA
ncbi:MAG TPA: phage holin family protein, partial [Actinomycetota bacterium]